MPLKKFYTENKEKRCYKFNIKNTSNAEKIISLFEKDLLDENLHTILDMEGVEYCNSLFIRICISFLKKYGHNKLEIINASDTVKRAIKISGFQTIFNLK